MTLKRPAAERAAAMRAAAIKAGTDALRARWGGEAERIATVVIDAVFGKPAADPRTSTEDAPRRPRIEPPEGWVRRGDSGGPQEPER